MDRLIKGVRQFQERIFPKQQALFQKLAKGQQPETLVIACSDSRVSLELMTQTSPGELFVCRNAGNIVPPYGHSDAMNASIEYAISVLPIRDIVVCGHSDCGAMKGLLTPQNLTDMPRVKDWLGHARGALRAFERGGDEPHSHEAPASLARLNIRLQLEHLHTYPEVFARVQQGLLRLHGWLYEIGTGDVFSWEPAEGSWVSLRETHVLGRMRRTAGGELVQHA